jgi:hypothetical protein
MARFLSLMISLPGKRGRDNKMVMIESVDGNIVSLHFPVLK